MEAVRPRFYWTPEAKERLRKLKASGLQAKQIAAEIGVSVHCIDNALRRHGAIPAGTLEENLDIPIFNGDLKLPMDDYIITCDYHSPYYSVAWHNRSLQIAERFGIKKLVVIGDLVDFGFASRYYSDHKPGIADEADENKRLIQSLLAQFEEIVVVKGNHEDRLGRQTNGLIQARYLFELWSGPEYGKRFKYSLYDKLTIGDEWLCVHPRSYSRVSMGVARLLAAKYHKNIINTHGHFLGYAYDISGQYLAIDLGGMFDMQKIEYMNIKSTTHPFWNPGFGMLKNGYFHLFDSRTDWDFWLGVDDV
jgi:hypothetical protein